MATLLGAETWPAVVAAVGSVGGGNGEWPMDENGSLLVTGLEK